MTIDTIKILKKFILWGFPILMIVPNIIFFFTESAPLIYRSVNIFVPLTAYFFIMSIWKNAGITILCMIPFMILNAFQIVIIALYGGGIIAVDMFLNVVTTNVSEASELLGSLWGPISFILLIYLPPLIWAVASLYYHWTVSDKELRLERQCALDLLALSVGVVAACYCLFPHYKISRQLYPVNIISNICEAINRTTRANEYPISSKNFSFNSKSTHNPSDREVYILVVGETSRACNWELFGYERSTNPILSKRDDIMAYPHALSESNTTHKSVPMILSHLESKIFGDSIDKVKGIPDAFRAAGYETAFFSMQRPNGSYIDYFGQEADNVRFLVMEGEPQSDNELLKAISEFINTSPSRKLFIVAHTYGSHFNYRDRYPEEKEVFTPVSYKNASVQNRDELINAYDNTIVYTDDFLNSIITELDSLHANSAMLYLSDHGEDIFDDSRQRFLHASPTPTYYQLHVPMVLWMSPEYVRQYPDKGKLARKHLPLQVSSTRSAFHTLIDVAGISTPYFNPSASLVNKSYREPERLYINDYNEAVPLEESGLKKQDFEMLTSKGCLTKE